MNHWKRWGRGAVAALALGGAAVASSGCVSLDNISAGQREVVGDVFIGATACQSGSADCSNVDVVNIDIAPSFTAPAQLLVAYRVPASLPAPTTIETDAPVVTFTASPSYAAELERLSPAGAGRKWVGFISNTIDTAAADKDLRVISTWKLPQGADGSPFAGPLAFRPIIGSRLPDATTPAEAPVQCGPDFANVGPSATVCLDSPLLATLSEPDLTRTTRDLGILTGATATGQSGTTVTVPFTAKYAGTSTSSANFALSATTAVPGGTAVVTPGSLLPATDSTNPVSVAVTVPAGTAPGNYDVTLTATLGTQTRVRTGTVTVTAPPVVTPPPVTPAALRLTGTLPSRLAFLTARTRGVKVIVRSNRTGRAVVRLVQGGKALVAKTVTLRNGATTVVLKTRKVKAGAYRVTVTFTATRKVTTLKGTLRTR